MPDSPAPKDISTGSAATTAAAPAEYSPNVIALVAALTKVCADVSDDVPTFTVIVFDVLLIISSLVWNAGSVALGNVTGVTLPSDAQVNVNPFNSISIYCPADKLCEPIVATNTPVTGSYVALVGVNCASTTV